MVKKFGQILPILGMRFCIKWLPLTHGLFKVSASLTKALHATKFSLFDNLKFTFLFGNVVICKYGIIN